MKSEIIHKSKIGLELLIPVILILGTVTTVMIINGIWLGLVICGLVILFMVNMYTSTSYKITSNNRLIIKCGIIETFDIDIMEIEWIKSTNEMTSAPALSIDRIEINYKGGRVIISPVDKEKFIADLRKANSKIWW
jgi:hypothetical protein